MKSDLGLSIFYFSIHEQDWSADGAACTGVWVDVRNFARLAGKILCISSHNKFIIGSMEILTIEP